MSTPAEQLTPTKKLSPAEFAGRIRSKYPDSYGDMDDNTLTQKVLTKYPTYSDLVDATPAPQDYKLGDNGAQPINIRGTEAPSRVRVPVVTNPFGAPRPYGEHTGIDLRHRLNTPIPAFAGGRVLKAANTGKGYGNRIEVQDEQGRVHTYSHLNRIDVRAGDVISAGQAIGLSGNTGGEYAPHLHYEIIERGRKINPADFLRSVNARTSADKVEASPVPPTTTNPRAARISPRTARPAPVQVGVGAEAGVQVGARRTQPMTDFRSVLPTIEAGQTERQLAEVSAQDEPIRQQLRQQVTQERRAQARTHAQIPDLNPDSIEREVTNRLEAERQSESERTRLMAQTTPAERERGAEAQRMIENEPTWFRPIEVGLRRFGLNTANDIAGVVDLEGKLHVAGVSPELASGLADYLRRQALVQSGATEEGAKRLGTTGRGVAYVTQTVPELVKLYLVTKGLGAAGVPARAVGPTAFGALNVVGAQGRNETPTQVLGAGAEGAATGALFDVAHEAPAIEAEKYATVPSRLGARAVNAAARAGVVGTGTAALTGDPHSALTNALFAAGLPAELAGGGEFARRPELNQVLVPDVPVRSGREIRVVKGRGVMPNEVEQPTVSSEAGAARETSGAAPVQQPEPFSEGEKAYIEQKRQEHLADEEIRRRENPSGYAPTVFDVQKAARGYRQQQQAATQQRRARNTARGNKGQFKRGRVPDEVPPTSMPVSAEPQGEEAGGQTEITSPEIDAARQRIKAGLANIRVPSEPTTEPVAAQTRVPSPVQTRARAKVEKADPRTGLKPTQRDYLANELVKVADEHIEQNTGEDEAGNKITGQEFRRKFAEEGGLPKSILANEMKDPVTIKVPDDGEFTVRSAQAANRLHQKITGQPMEGFERAQGTRVARGTPQARGSHEPVPFGRYVESVGGKYPALEALKRQHAQLEADPAAAEDMGVSVDELAHKISSLRQSLDKTRDESVVERKYRKEAVRKLVTTTAYAKLKGAVDAYIRKSYGRGKTNQAIAEQDIASMTPEKYVQYERTTKDRGKRVATEIPQLQFEVSQSAEVPLSDGRIDWLKYERKQIGDEAADALYAPKPRLSRLTPTERASYERASANLKEFIDPNKLHDISDLASILPDLITVGKHHIVNGAREFKAFSERMIGEFGEVLRPYLKELHERSLQALGETSEARTTQPGAEGSGTTIRGMGSPERQPADRAVEQVTPGVEQGGGAGSVSPRDVQAGARPQVVPPVTERGPTGTKNAITGRERAERGLSPVEKQAYTAIGESYLSGKQAVERGEIDPRSLAEGIAKRPRPLTTTEVGALGYERTRLKVEHKQVLKSVSDAIDGGDTEKALAGRDRLERIEQDLDANDKALQRGGREQSAAFQARKMLITEDYDLASMVNRAKAAKGEALTTEERSRFEELSRKYEEAQSKLAEYEGQKEQRTADRAAQDTVDRMQRQVAREGRRVRRAASAQQLDADFAAIKGRLAKAWIEARKSHGMAAVDPEGEITKALGEMALNRVRAGVVKAEQLVDDIYNALKDDLPGLTRRYVQEKVSLYGKQSQPTTDPIKLTLADLKEQIRLALAIEDVEAGQPPEHSGYQHRPSSATALAMRRELTEKMKASGLVMGERDPMPAVKRRLQQAIDRHEETLRRGVLAPRPTRAEVKLDAEAKKLQAQRDALSEQIKAERRKYPVQGPRLSEAVGRKEGPRDWRAETIKRLDKQITAAETKLAQMRAGTYVEPPKREALPFDRESQRLKAKLEGVKDEIEQEILKKKKMGLGDYIAKIRQTFVLSGLGTLGKLSAAVTGRGVTSLPEEALGGVLSRVMPKLAAKAAREGRFSGRAEAQSAKQYFTKDTYKDAWQKLKTGQNELDLLYGDKTRLNHPVLDFFARVHGAFKTPAQRAEFYRSIEKRTAQARRQGRDVTSDVVQMELGTEAYADSKRAILMNDNLATDLYKSGLTILEKKAESSPDRLTRGAAKTAAVVGRVIFPVVKVPTNYAIEASSYLPVVGAVKGISRIILAHGVENMTPMEADATLRAFKKQGIGLGLVAIGFFNPDMFGGYYDPNDKSKKIKPGDIKIFGVTIPHKLLHTPALEALQWGATLRKVSNQTHGPRGHKSIRGLGEGTYRATLGLAEQVPFVDSVFDWGRAAQDYGSAQKFAGETTSGLVTPSILRDVARWTDKDVVRQPKTFGQAVERDIPFLRQRVPVKPVGRSRTR